MSSSAGGSCGCSKSSTESCATCKCNPCTCSASSSTDACAGSHSCPCGPSCKCDPPCKCGVGTCSAPCKCCASSSSSSTCKSTCCGISSELDLNRLSTRGSIGEKFNFRWQQVMLRIKDPKATLAFYQTHFGMKLVHSYDFSSMGFSLYFLERTRDGVELPAPGTPESEKYLWDTDSTLLELTHNHGTENDSNLKMNNGNEEPHRGFGHIAFNTNDVYSAAQELEKNGVSFHKRPDEGRMKGLAFALDPSGYWIELVERSKKANIKETYNLSQCMLRVKDISKSLHFYVNIMGMHLMRAVHHDDFSLYFLACLPPGEKHPDPTSEECRDYCKSLWRPLLELTHNHGTEKNENFSYHNGNDQPQGYGHICFLCDDLEKACQELQATNQVLFKKKPQDGKMRGIAFVYDPDMYWVELIQKSVTFPSEKQ